MLQTRGSPDQGGRFILDICTQYIRDYILMYVGCLGISIFRINKHGTFGEQKLVSWLGGGGEAGYF